MLSKWLTYQKRHPLIYKFPVIDVTELIVPNDEVIDYLALALLLAHGNPQKIKDQYEKLLRDAEDTQLDILRKYLEGRVFPDKKRVSTRIANFGEALAATFLTEFENFWFPIYKLRFREKKDWAMRLTDLCLIKQLGESKILACYGEVKTISGARDLKIAIKGHDSLVSGDVLADPEILHFTSTILYEADRLEEAQLISDIELGLVEYDKRHDLFIVHTKEKWTDKILDELENYPLNQGLIDFSVKVFLISQLRQVIETTYEQSSLVTKALIDSMDKRAYLLNTHRRLETLFNDRGFQRELARVQVRSIQEELLSEQPTVHFPIDTKDVWRKCDYIFSTSSLILRESSEIAGTAQENLSQRKALLGYLRTVAQSFEHLSTFALTEEKEILLINAAICYHITGYHANAQCLIRLVENKYQSGQWENNLDNLDEHLTFSFRSALTGFLRRDIVKLQHTTQETLSYIVALQEKVLLDADDETTISEIANLNGHLFFQKSLFNFAKYCIDGHLGHFALAHKNIQKSYEYFQEIRDVRLGILASELRTLFALFEGQSTWSNVNRYGENLVENPIWRAYLRNLAFERSVVEFWPSQLKALQGNLLMDDDSFIVQMPTSAGKTFIAELAILASLTRKQQTRCLYIAPYRALANEVEERVADTLGAVGYRVVNLAGDFEFDSFQDFLASDSNVLVATPEKVDLLFRAHPQYFENISTVIIDEGHMLDEGIPSQSEVGIGKTLSDELEQNGSLGRGLSLELLITRLKYKLPFSRFLFLSAVMAEIDADDFVAWLARNRKEPLRIDRTDRPSRQTIASFSWEEAVDANLGPDGKLQFISPVDDKYTSVPYFLQRRKYRTGERTPKGDLKTITWPENTINKSQGTALLAAKFSKTGPVLVFCAMTSEVRNVTENTITSLKYLEASDQAPRDDMKYVQNPNMESFNLAKEWLGEDHPLVRGLHYRVGLHYGPLPHPVRQAVEDDFRNGKIQILVCTNTLGQGVNMPVKTAIIYSLQRSYYDHEKRKRKVLKVKKRDFWNICGRAGRAGRETEGQIIFVTYSEKDAQLLNEYKDDSDLERVESPLYKLLDALIKKRITQDELLNYLDPHVLALLAEEVVDTQDEKVITDFLKASLIGVQAQRMGSNLKPLASTIQRTSIRINHEVPDKAQQKIFSSTGLQLRSCKVIEEAVESFLQKHTKGLAEAEAKYPYLDEKLLEHAFTACQDIFEMKSAEGLNEQGPEEELKLIKDWLAGKSISEIRLTYWSQDKKDKFGEYLANRIIYRLPWVINGFLRILAFKLNVQYEELPISWQYIPSMIKLGVNNAVACWVGNFGISSRELIRAIAEIYPKKDSRSFAEFVKWIVNLPTEFLLEGLTEGSTEEKKRLIRKINQVTADDNHLNFVLRKQRTLEASVDSIAYNNRQLLAVQVRPGDQLSLEAEADNPYDRNAVKVLFKGEQIGYIQRDKARIIARELRQGRKFQAYAKVVRLPIDSDPFPHIEMVISAQ